jgi:phosphinothricin acetyltransferase
MDEPQIREASPEDLPSVGAAWRRLQEFHQNLGLAFPLDADSAVKWVSSFQRTLGRFSFLWVVGKPGQVSGFLLARLKQSPAFLGSLQVGEISDLFVDDSLRGTGIGTRLVQTAMQEFTELGVHSVEVQIQAGNDAGLLFWQKLGFKTDLTLVRKLVTSSHAPS